MENCSGGLRPPKITARAFTGSIAYSCAHRDISSRHAHTIGDTSLRTRLCMKVFSVLRRKVLNTARGWAYVLMPDHFHAFVAIDDQKLDLSIWTKSLKNSISKTLRQTGIAPPHWRKTFFDHLLRSAESYMEKWYYVRENPVRAGLVSRWED